ncbi:MAG: hypothetical protein HPY62_10655 [Bacteroidales bacterium]|nr:hypothetical protein [Bacteroidales bacterium]
MKSINAAQTFLKIIAPVVMLILFLITGCKQEELENQIMLLNQQNLLLGNEKDSLFKIIEAKKAEFDTLTAHYNTLSEENKALLGRLKSLQAGYNSRGAELKKAAEEKVVLTQTIEKQNTRYDSLHNVVVTLQSNIADLNNKLSESEVKSTYLTQELKEKQTRIAADSIAEVERLSRPKENGFVDIVEIAGGFGLSETNQDYAERVITLNNIFGYQINKNFLAGIGAGVHLYNGGTTIPLYIDMRYFLRKPNLSPIIIADGGFMIDPSGPSLRHFIHPAIGLNKKLGPRTHMQISAGLLTIHAPTGIRSSFITVKGGVSFAGKRGPEDR